MNLHAIASPLVSVINPTQTVTIQVSTGSTTLADGTRVPTYVAPVAAPAQVQPLSSGDLRMLDGVNLGGDERALYVFGMLDSVLRLSQRGGDLVTFADGSVWLTILSLEDWPGSNWSKAAIRMQNDR